MVRKTQSIIKNIFFISFFLYQISNAGDTQVYFSPDDKPSVHLTKALRNAQKKIYVAVYMFTHKKIARELIAAKKRGVDVQVVTDQSCVESAYSCIPLLKKHGIDVFTYPSYFFHNGKKKKNGLMHHKFALVDRSLWLGSFNWTRAADYSNQENLNVFHNSHLYARYDQQFSLVKYRCMHTSVSQKKSSKKKGTAFSRHRSFVGNRKYLARKIR